MILTFDSRQHARDIVQAANQARAEVEPGGSKCGRFQGPVEHRQANPQSIVDDRLERQAALLRGLRKASRHVFFKGECGSHDVMLEL